MTSQRSPPSLALAAIASLALTACGRDDDAGAGGEDQGEAIDEGKATGTIEVWAMGTEGEELGDFAAAFEEANPDARSRSPRSRGTPRTTRSPARSPAGETPDVSLIGTTWMGEFAEAGGLEPTPEGLVDEADFFPGAWGSTEVGGTSYGVPWYVETRVLYYRKDLAEKAGWAEAPQTWDDLKQFAEDMQSQGRRRVRHQPASPAGTGSWQTMHAVRLVQRRRRSPTRTAPSTRSTARRWPRRSTTTRRSSTRGSRRPGLLDPGELESGFADGTYRLLHLRPVAHRPGRGRRRRARTQYAVAPLPGPDGAPGTSFVGGGDLAVFKDSDNRTPPGSSSSGWPSPRPSRSSTTRSATCRPCRPPGRPASSPTTRSCRSSASSSRAPRPRRPSRPGSRSPASIDSEIEQASQGRH